MPQQVIINNFSAGELSPRMAGAIGSAVYSNSCARLENFLPRAVSGADKRPGTLHMGATASNADAVLVPYLDDAGHRWVLEFSAALIRYWDAETHALGSGSTTSPYSAAHIRELKFAQTKNYLYIVHPSYAVRVLSRTSSTWTLATPTFVGAEWPVVVDVSTSKLMAIGADRIAADLAVLVRASAGGSLPTGLSAGTTYYITRTPTRLKRDGSDETETTFQLSASVGGAAITLSSPGSGVVYVRDTTAVPFNAAGRYPSACAFYAGRLYLVVPPNEIWASRTFDPAGNADRFDDFSLGARPDSALCLKEMDMASSKIHWLCPHLALVAGSEWAEWASSGEIPTPSTFDLRQHAPYGASPCQAAAADVGVAYVRAGGRQVALLAYSGEGGGYKSLELTMMADHVGVSGIRQLAVQTVPELIIWAVREDGVLLSCTLDLSTVTAAWARHVMGGSGLVESVCVQRGAVEDEMWIVVKRGSVRSMERLAPRHFDSALDAHFVDDGLDLTLSSPATTVTGLGHLEGAEVEAFADGAVLPARTVVSGSVVYDTPVTRIHIGRPYSAYLSPSPPAHQGRMMRIVAYLLRIYRGLGGRVGPDEARAEAIVLRTPQSQPMGSPVPLFSGDVRRSFPGSIGARLDILVVHDDPTPMSILAVMLDVQALEV